MAELSLPSDPFYEPIARRFHQDPQALADAFAAPGSSSPTATWGPRPALSALKSRPKT
jgi:catalase-peroxidase